MDMDGVLVHEEDAIPGADRFLARLQELGLPFLVLTNNSIYTRRDLAARLRTSGLDVPEESIGLTAAGAWWCARISAWSRWGAVVRVSRLPGAGRRRAERRRRSR